MPSPCWGCDGGGGCLPQLHQRRGRPVRSAGPKLKELDLWDLYATAELPLCRVLAEMELAGCRVDKGALVSFGRCSPKRPPLWSRTFTIWPGRNSTSTPQAAGRNFIRQAGPAPRQENENRLVHQCRCAGKAALRGPIVGAVLEYRQYAKLKSTYAEGF